MGVRIRHKASEVAALCPACNPEGLQYKNRLAGKHGQGKALAILSHKLGRTVFYILKRGQAFDMNRFLSA